MGFGKSHRSVRVWRRSRTQGGVYLTPRVQLKYWPIETNGQAAVWAALELRAKSTADELKRDRGLYLEVYLVRNRQRAGEVGPKDARDGGSQLAVYFRPRSWLTDRFAFLHSTTKAVRDPALRPLMQRSK